MSERCITKFKVENIRSCFRDQRWSKGKDSQTEVFTEIHLHFKDLCLASVARSWHLGIAGVTFSDNFISGKRETEKKAFLMLYVYFSKSLIQ